MQYVALTCRCALLVVFLAAVVGKLHSRAAFNRFRASVTALTNSHRRVSAALSGATVLVEAGVVVLLVIPRTVSAGLILAGLALLGFCAAIASAMRSRAAPPCRCFGAAGAPLGGRHLVRNAGLLVLVTAGLTAGVGAAHQTLHPAGAALGLAAAAVLALAVLFFDDLVDLLTEPRLPAGSR
ncbi:MauE/DoxX family redox-associated membrane protein [Actinoallomurus sp. NPDC050550]|uniref:MauE/DoxX family redox-associated membrane protein n=1 Tax=Actinoallomurus sp. NPDC050550 TaxID=3154937 RepID=UPI0033E1E7DD